jgi:hypothetical protein
MKKTIQVLAIAFMFCLATVAWVSASSHGGQDHGEMDHSGHDHGKMDHSGHDMDPGSMDHGSMDHGGHMGEMIHKSTVDGYEFMYHLIDMREKMKGMENMPEMKATHHLMVYVKDPSGNPVAQAKGGYLIEKPDGSDQRVMTMPMSGGHGADIALDAPGTYVVKTKVIAGDQTMMDRFEYEVK